MTNSNFIHSCRGIHEAGVKKIEDSIKVSWTGSNISGVIEDGILQIFDGRHRLLALKSLGKEIFESYFGKKSEGEENGVRVSVYRDLDAVEILSLSQSFYFKINFQISTTPLKRMLKTHSLMNLCSWTKWQFLFWTKQETNC